MGDKRDLVVLLICTGAERDEVFCNELLIFYTIVAVGIIAGVEVLLFDTPSFRFSVSESGITMYIRLKKYLVRWDEIVQWDIVQRCRLTILIRYIGYAFPSDMYQRKS